MHSYTRFLIKCPQHILVFWVTQWPVCRYATDRSMTTKKRAKLPEKKLNNFTFNEPTRISLFKDCKRLPTLISRQGALGKPDSREVSRAKWLASTWLSYAWSYYTDSILRDKSRRTKALNGGCNVLHLLVCTKQNLRNVKYTRSKYSIKNM